MSTDFNLSQKPDAVQHQFVSETGRGTGCGTQGHNCQRKNGSVMLFQRRASRAHDCGLVLILAYGVCLAERDAFSVSQWLSTRFEFVYLASVGLLLALVLYCAAFGANARAKSNALMRFARYLALAYLLTAFVTSLIKSGAPLTSTSIALHDGVAVLVIWVTLFNADSGMRGLYAFVIVQAALSAAVITGVAGFEMLDGAKFQLEHGQFVLDAAHINVFALDKAEVGELGVHHNPNALGLYAAIAFVLGLSQVLGGVGFRRQLGLFLAATGAFLWTQSLTRGPAIAICVSAIVPVAVLMARGRGLRAVVAATLLALLALVCTMALPQLISHLIPDANNVSVSGRVEGYIAGWTALNSSFVLGVADPSYWNSRPIPHLFPLLAAANFGAVAGVLATALLPGVPLLAMWVVGCGSARGSVDVIQGWKITALLMICISIGMTNNVAAPFLLWATIGQCLIECSSGRASRGGRSLA